MDEHTRITKRPRLERPSEDALAEKVQADATTSQQNVDFSLPVIDVAPFREICWSWDAAETLPEAAATVARDWRRAFAEYGFAHVVGHGVPDDVIEDAYRIARQFFSLPQEVKSSCDLGKGYGAGGYIAQGGERVSSTASLPDGSKLLGAARARPPDRVESMIVHRKSTDVIPAEVEGYAQVVNRYHDELAKVLRLIMRLTACSLELPMDHFEPHFFGEGGVGAESCIGECSLRLAYYPPAEEGAPAGQLRYGEHTDYTGFTILWQDHNEAGPQTVSHQSRSVDSLADVRPPRGGLQVRMPDGVTWVDCPPVPGAFTVNAGDLIQVWSNDVLLSNMHRVSNPPRGDAGDRVSLVYFTGPAPETVVDCLPTCFGPDRPKRYAPVTAGQHLSRKLRASNK